MLGATNARIEDPYWEALRLLEQGRIPAPIEPMPSVEPPLEQPPHQLALELLMSRARGDRGRSAAYWWRLIREPCVDARIFAALAEEGEDAIAAGARAVLRWGRPSDETRIAYGFPNSPIETCPHDFTRFAEVLRGRVAQFEERGYIALRGLLHPSLVRAWSRDIMRRYLQATAQQPSLADSTFARTLDTQPFGAGTVQWQHNVVPIPLLSMELAATLDALLGGMDRLVPWMSDQLSVSRHRHAPVRLHELPCMSRRDMVEVLKASLARGLMRLPQPVTERIVKWSFGRRSWHLDETPSQGRIEEQKLGAIGLLLLTDVSEADGPTVFLPESPPLVARSLRDRPGRDQDDRRWTASIARQCERMVLATGRAGDLFLIHPLTLHARAPVWRSSMRIIANPNFFAKRPLSYLQPRSPVERYAARDL